VAPPARDLSFDLRQHHGVETPEHVDVRLELAGVGSRLAAAVLDTFLIWLAVLGLLLVNDLFMGTASEASSWATAVLILLAFLVAAALAAVGVPAPGAAAALAVLVPLLDLAALPCFSLSLALSPALSLSLGAAACCWLLVPVKTPSRSSSIASSVSCPR